MNNAEVLIKFKGDSSQLDKTTDQVKGNVSSKLGGVAKGIGTAFLKGAAVASTAMVGMVATGIKEYAKLEQSMGGTKLLFGDAADYIEQKSKEAYKNAGLSANDYLEQVNGLAVGLKNSMGGNAQAAAELANKVITAEADIVAATGNSQEAVQNAFNGIMKGNYMMLDNLQLGIKPTKEGMQEVIDKMNQWNAEQGRATNYQMGNYADMQAALVDYVEAQGLAGYAAKEANSTLSGSFASMKAAFTNFLSGAGDVDQLIDSVTTFANNLVPKIVEMAPKIIQGVVTLLNYLISQLPTLINTLIPPLMDGLIQLVYGVLDVLPEILDALINALIVIVTVLAQEMPTLIPQIVDAILQLIPVLIDNLPLFIKAGYQLIIGIIEGLLKAIPVIWNNVPKIGKAILNYFKTLPSTLIDVGKNMIKGLWNGMSGLKDWAINKVKAMGKSILKGLKSALGIHSPSTEFALIGKYSVLGYTEALDKMKKDVESQVADTFGLSPQLTGSMQNSFSPNVNVYNNVNVEQDPLGQMVKTIKTYSGGSPNDYNYGAGV